MDILIVFVYHKGNAFVMYMLIVFVHHKGNTFVMDILDL